MERLFGVETLVIIRSVGEKRQSMKQKMRMTHYVGLKLEATHLFLNFMFQNLAKSTQPSKISPIKRQAIGLIEKRQPLPCSQFHIDFIYDFKYYIYILPFFHDGTQSGTHKIPLPTLWVSHPSTELSLFSISKVVKSGAFKTTFILGLVHYVQLQLLPGFLRLGVSLRFHITYGASFLQSCSN